MAFYLRMKKDGVDLYPRLFAAMNDPKVYDTNKVRFELMKRLGYFVTESSEHNAEYNPYFIPRGKDVIHKYDVPIDEYLRRCDGIVDEFERMKTVSKDDSPMAVHRSHEVWLDDHSFDRDGETERGVWEYAESRGDFRVFRTMRLPKRRRWWIARGCSSPRWANFPRSWWRT